MPRASKSQVSRIVDFFRTEKLEVAQFVFDLCKDALTERRQKSAKAKIRSGQGNRQVRVSRPPAASPPSPPIAAAGPSKRAPKKRRAKKPKPPRVVEQEPPLPLQEGPYEAIESDEGDRVPV